MSYRSVYLTILIALSFISLSLAFQPQTKAELQTAVDLWVSDNPSALSTYGEIDTWDVSLITDMNDLFKDKSTLNDDIGNWDVSSVTSMGNMFRNADSFNQDLSTWNVSSVTNMGSMFYSADNFNGDISSWNVSSVTDMQRMFYGADAFNQDLSNWNVSSVTTMREMFYNAQAFNQDLSSWDVSSVTTMEGMFYNANNFSSDLSGWDVSSVTNMSIMFYEADNFDSDLSAWDVSSVTNMRFLFRDTHQFNSDISGWDVSSVTDMHTMFGASNFNQDISDWDVSNVTDFSAMFWRADALSDANKCAINTSFSSNTNWPYDWSDNCYQFETRDELVTAVDLWIADNSSALATYGPINSWDVSLITNMTNLFYFKDFNDDISNWDVSSVVTMSFMFHNCPFNQDISSWDVSSVNNMHRMFYNSAFDQDISSWDVSHVGVDGGFAFHEFGGSFSDENRCLIHTSFSQQNENWPYNWSGYCAIEGYTYVPNDNFEQALIDLGYDDVIDNYVVTENISDVTSLVISNFQNSEGYISDLTGIGDFTALTYLNVEYNSLTTLDMSANTALTQLRSYGNDLTSINVSANTELVELHCGGNELTSLDLTNNTALTILGAQRNSFTSLDLSNNVLLETLFLKEGDLTSLDVSNNTALGRIECFSNSLETLDFSNNPALYSLKCYNNQLTSLNMRNGVTDQLTTFNATNNPDLTCIETLDPTYAMENWTSIDEGATFSVICGTEQQDSLWHVATTGSDASGDGSQDNPFSTIQTGINAAGDGNRVLVAAGTYVENIIYSGKSISITGEDREITIIDADTSGRAFYFEGFDQNTIAFSGFTITNGESYHGAGIYIKNSIGIDLFDLIVNENNSTGSGAGGGIHIHDSMGELHNVHIENNEAYSGGGIYMGNSDIILDHVNVLNNNGRNRCGGTGFGSDQFDESTTEWTNSVFIGNTGLYQGSAMCMGDSVIISNLTITQNTAYNSALTGVGNWTIVNSIISDNLVSANVEADAEINFGTGTLNMSYTNLSGEINAFNLSDESELILGEGNIDLDPIFCDPDNGDFHLAENSPCAFSGEDGSNNMGALDIGCDAIWVPPVLSAIADTSMDEDNELELILSAYSQDGYEIYFEVQSDSSSVYTHVHQDTLTISLMEDWYGVSEITVVAYSEHGYDINDSTSFIVTVEPVDDLPYVDGHIFPLSYDEDFGVDTVAYLPDVFMDIDGELEFSYSFSETGILSADINEGHLVLSSVLNANGFTEVFVTASNPVRASITDTVQVEIFSVNDAPTVSFREVFMYEDSVYYLTPLSEFIGDADYDDLFLDVIYISEPMNEFIDIHFYGTDTMAIVSYDDWNGSGQIEVLVSDGQEQVSGTFDLDILPVNDNPMFHQMQALVSVWDGFEVYLHLSDVDMDSLSVSFDEHAEYPSWLSIESNPYRLVGMAPEALDIQFPLLLTDGVVTVIDTFHLSAQHFNPRITSIDDIPSDQGGKVYVHFLPSFFDHSNGTGQMYTVFRRDVVDTVSQWVVVLSGGAIGDTQYTYEVPTLMDSTTDHEGITSFKIVASMNEGNFHSQVGTGYSIDNIAPGVPTGIEAIAMDNSIFLNWDMSEAEDFQYFQLERSSTAAGLDTTVIIELIENTYEDFNVHPGTEYSYKLAAYDYAGNRSEFTEPVSAILLSVDPLSLVPEVFALHQNYPNPFNPTTQIRYDLPLDEYVTVIIYDVMGRKIKSLINTNQEAGYRSITWDAINDLGQPVSAGMYIYTIQAGEFRKTRKMVLLK